MHHGGSKTHWQLVLAALLLGLILPTTTLGQVNRPTRLLLPQVQAGAATDPGFRAVICLELYLRDRFEQVPSVLILEGRRPQAVYDWLTSGAMQVNPDTLLPQLKKHLPVDGLLTYSAQGLGDNDPRPAGITLRLNMDGQVREKFFEITPMSGQRLAISRAVRAAADQLGQWLNLPAEQRKLLTQVRIDNENVFQFHYATSRVTAKWPTNPQQTAMEWYSTVGDQEDPSMATALLNSGVNYVLAAKRRDSDLIAIANTAVRRGLVRVLGTPDQALVHPLIDAGEIEGITGQLENILHLVASPLVYQDKLPGAPVEDDVKVLDLIEQLDTAPADGLGGGMLGGDAEEPDQVFALTGVKDFDVNQRCGALRLLGRMKSPKALADIHKIVYSKDPSVRAAAVEALGYYEQPAERKLVDTYLKDPQPGVALQAALAIERRGDASPQLLPLARKLLDDPHFAEQARKVILRVGDRDDLPRLEQWMSQGPNELAKSARLRWMQLVTPSSDEFAALLSDTDEQVLMAALAQVPDDADQATVEQVLKLVDDPYPPIALAARAAAVKFRPGDPDERLLFDLRTSHPYLRRRLLEKLVKENHPLKVRALMLACEDANAQVRAVALQQLAAGDLPQAHDQLVKALADPHRWVRLYAASLLEDRVTPADAQVIAQAKSVETDEAIGLYLADLDAKAHGQPLPPPREPAKSIKGKRNLTWMCGGGDPNSPYDGYYMLGNRIGDAWKQASKAGKIMFPRATPHGYPAQLVIDAMAFDQAVLRLDAEFPTESLAYVDGFILGEETMKMAPNALWPDAWQLFCEEAAIDPATIDGSLEKLSESQRLAWTHWSNNRWVEGFNLLYDYIKLRTGKLRPGIAVGTYMTSEPLGFGAETTQGDLNWKFDMGGIYNYYSCERYVAYALTRRHKTIWPDRQIMWLSNGLGIYEKTVVRYTANVPDSIDKPRWWRPYTQSLSAWLAGADSGFFSVWIFVDKDLKIANMGDLRGPSIQVEQITPTSKSLKNCVDYVWGGVLDMWKTEADMANAKQQEPTLKDDDLDMNEFMANFDDSKPAYIQKELDGKAAMFLGFNIYAKYVNDVARVMSSLPRIERKPDTLVVQPGLGVWSGFGDTVDIPGAGLLNHFDFLLDINKLAHKDLSQYRVIVISDPGRLRDDTIAALTDWLAKTPGILYLHKNIADDNAFEASTIEDMDGHLQNDWPWESDIRFAFDPDVAPPRRGAKPRELTFTGDAGSITTQGGLIFSTLDIANPARVQTWLSHEGKPVLAVWRDPKLKGAVVFDGVGRVPVEYLQFLREKLRELHTASGIGLALAGPTVHQMLSDDAFVADVTSSTMARSREAYTHQGVDALTGELNPTVGPKRGAALILKEYQGRYLAAHDGVTLLLENPNQAIEKIPGGFRVTAKGWVQAAAATGKVSVKTESGQPLPAVEDVNHWLIMTNKPGLALHVPRDQPALGTVAYVRSEHTLLITAE